MKYFSAGLTPDELQREYRRLCKELHPDRGGNGRRFVEMRDEYQKIITQNLDAVQETEETTTAWSDLALALLQEIPELRPIITWIADSEYFQMLKIIVPERYVSLIEKVAAQRR